MKYEIWSEGYRATGESSGVMFHGEIEAASFEEACNKYFKDYPCYDAKRSTYWGCKLFDNELEARNSFG